MMKNTVSCCIRRSAGARVRAGARQVLARCMVGELNPESNVFASYDQFSQYCRAQSTYALHNDNEQDQLLIDFAQDYNTCLSNNQNHKARKFDDNHAVLPKTLEEALLPSNRATVITTTARPYPIVHVNEAWEDLCGYTRHEVLGQSMKLLHGNDTDEAAISCLLNKLCNGEEAGLVLHNYKRDGSKFRNRLRVGPIMDGGRVTHYVGILNEL